MIITKNKLTNKKKSGRAYNTIRTLDELISLSNLVIYIVAVKIRASFPSFNILYARITIRTNVRFFILRYFSRM